MSFDFETLIDRSACGAMKWNNRTDQEKRLGYLALTAADMELPVAPCIRDAVVAAAEGVYGYTEADGRYFDAVAGWMLKRHAWKIEREWLVCDGGVVPAIGMAVRAFTDKGDGVVIQTPVYHPFAQTIGLNGRVVVENPLKEDCGRYAMDLEDLEYKTRPQDVKLLILCSPHNPVGRVWTREELMGLGRVCEKNDVLVVSDEIHFDFDYKGAHSVLTTLSPQLALRSVILTAPSKTFNLAGLQLANTFIPNPVLRKAYLRQQEITGLHSVPYFGRAAAIAAYTDGESWLEELLLHIQKNYALLSRFLGEYFPLAILSPLEGTYLAWIDWRCLKLAPEELGKALRQKAGFIVNQGTMFGQAAAGFTRLNLALPTAELKKTLDRLGSAAKDL